MSENGPAAFVMEPSAFDLPLWSESSGVISHTALVEVFPGLYPLVDDPDYPGKSSWIFRTKREFC